MITWRQSAGICLGLFLAQAVVTGVYGSQDLGILNSDLIQLMFGIFALVMCLQAAMRSGPFGCWIWRLTGVAIGIWAAGQVIISYNEGVLHLSTQLPWFSDPLVFFWVVPLFLTLAISDKGQRQRFDLLQALDFLQIVLLAVASYLALLWTSERWTTAPDWMVVATWNTTNVRDSLLVAALVARSFLAKGLTRRLFENVAVFFTGYAVADLVYHLAEHTLSVTSGHPLDLLWSVPFAMLAMMASAWNENDESELQNQSVSQRSQRVLFFGSVFLPAPVLLLSVMVTKERPIVAGVLMVATLTAASLRMVVTQRRQNESERLQAALYQIAERSNSAEDLQDLYRSIHAILMELMFARNCYIAIFDEEADTVSFPYWVDEKTAGSPGPRKGGKGLTEYVLRTGLPLLAKPETIQAMEASGEFKLGGHMPLDWMGVPLRMGAQPFGVLTVQTYTPNIRYGEKEKAILTFVSQQVASAIEHRRTQDSLRESESQFRALAENALAAIFIWDGHSLPYANPATERLLEYAEGEVAALTSPEVLLHPDDRDRIDQVRVRMEAKEMRPGLYEFRVVTRTGRTLWLQSSLSPIRFRGKESIVGVAFDVTERKRIEDQLRQAQKMEAIGRLSGGIAHDFNNLLTVIQFASQELRSSLASEPTNLAQLEEIVSASDRAASLTGQLLAFSRQQVLQPKIINFNDVVHNMETMLRRMIGEDIDLAAFTAPDLGLVRADPGQLEQVIMNLALNARDAMPNGGKLTVETGNVTLHVAHVQEHPEAKPGDFVMLAVSDTGTGMNAAERAHIFEPFFTTKEVGKGTGLGLSTVYGIVQQSGGHVSVYSEKGEGTTFKVFLPRVPAEAEIVIPIPERRKESVGGKETILLVEDDPQVKLLTITSLTKLGYQVLTGENAKEIEDVCRTCPDAIDLLITDVVMPSVSGTEMARRVTALRPGIRVLFMSGYTDSAIERHGVLAQGSHFLQKPFTPRVLAAKIREVLASDQPALQKP